MHVEGSGGIVQEQGYGIQSFESTELLAIYVKVAAGRRELVSITYIDKALLCLHFTISLRTYAPLAPVCTWQVSCNAYQMLQ